MVSLGKKKNLSGIEIQEKEQLQKFELLQFKYNNYYRLTWQDTCPWVIQDTFVIITNNIDFSKVLSIIRGNLVIYRY